jgi:predicted nucleotidyltransferase
MTEYDMQIARELKKRLSREFAIKEVRIFGSRARGDNDKYSDFDIFIEVDPLSREIKNRIREIAWEVGIENAVVISPIIFSSTELSATPLRSSPFVRNVFREGIQI